MAEVQEQKKEENQKEVNSSKDASKDAPKQAQQPKVTKAPEVLIQPGDIVMMQGLKGRAEWNGKLAMVIGKYVPDKNRYPIETVDGKNALLKPDNLRLYQKRQIKQNLEMDDCCGPSLGGGGG
mmetsp:Transcript_22727/g.19978  ORF Transcript_22727/g.19978 Transcript_22727/m.19978 type:complete len:123 (-) Transcript_22727:48-416(-)